MVIGLGRSEGADRSHQALVLLPRVHACDGVEGAKLQSTVADDADHGDTEASVKSKEASGACHRLLDAVPKASEGLLARTNIGGKARTCVVERVNDGEAACGCQATRDEIGSEELPELGLGIVLREHLLEGVLEGKIERLRGEVA